MLTGTLAHGYILYSVLSPSYYTIHSDPKCEKKDRFGYFAVRWRKIHQKGICLEQNTAAVKEDKVGQHHKLYPLQRLLLLSSGYTTYVKVVVSEYISWYYSSSSTTAAQQFHACWVLPFGRQILLCKRKNGWRGAAFPSKLRRSSKPDKKSKCKLWCTKINSLVALQGGAGKQWMENEDAHSSTPSRGGRGKNWPHLLRTH